ncbi:MAG: extracellular solute-binding protein [Propionibacteriaceae bacterium]|jgi:ABC-type glycerol-3-phosphate transport system substrate-binding protein|nr:extracellular solute-binding protein [Propionibacteriaceae bacterium]
MKKMMRVCGGLAVTLGLVLAAGCTSSPQPTPGSSGVKPSGEVVLWDYYGESTPLKDIVAKFSAEHPEITVKYEAYAYDAISQKFPVAASSAAAPDLATIDMTWIPQYASAGLLADLGSFSGGTLNGQPMQSAYSAGAYSAMQYDGHLVTAMMDFDAYALYYRQDLLQAAGLSVPKTFDDFVDVSAKLAKGEGSKRTQAVLMPPSVFHFAGALAREGGQMLSPDNTKATFNSAEGVQALTNQKRLLDAGGLYWGPDAGDYIAGIADGRVAMFIDGPYMMGVLKSGAADQKGKWGVATTPYSKQPGSYLGGTGLVIPTGARNGTAAWVLAQYILQPENQELLYTKSGAAPATLAGLARPALTEPDPYFGGQTPFAVFKDAMATAVAFPNTSAWAEISKSLNTAVESVYLGKATPADALNTAAQESDAALNG